MAELNDYRHPDLCQLSKSVHRWQWQRYDLKIHVLIGSSDNGSDALNELKMEL